MKPHPTTPPPSFRMVPRPSQGADIFTATQEQNLADRRSGGGEQTNLDTCYHYLRGHTNKTKFIELTNGEAKLDSASP